MTFLSLKTTEAGAERLERSGYSLTSTTNLRLGGDVYEKRTYTLQVDLCARLIQPSVTALSCIATVGCFFGSCGGICMDEKKEGPDRGHSLCDTCCFEPIEGERERTRYVFNDIASQRLFKEDSIALKYQLTRPADRKAYMQVNASKIYECFGHKFLTYHAPKSGFSCGLYAIQGDFNQIEWRTHFSAKTGDAFNTLKLHETAIKWCTNYRPGNRAISQTTYANFTIPKKNRDELTQPLLEEAPLGILFNQETA